MNDQFQVVLWLFVVNLGIATGAGLYEQRIVMPQWFRRADMGIRVDSAAMRSTDTGRSFWAFVTTGPLTLLTVANLIAAWQSAGPRHDWWMGAALITLVERLATFSYFIPTALRLMRADTVPSATIGEVAERWMAVNRVRALLTLCGWLAALRALSMGS